MRRVINSLGGKILLRIFRSCIVAEYDGIEIASTRDDGEAFATEILGALVFLRDYDPRRFRIVQATTDLIVERTLPYGENSGEYRHRLRATSIDYSPLDPAWDEFYRRGFFAGLIIHEATHGRLSEFGIATTRENRVQIESICVTEENRFYTRIGHLRDGLTDDLYDHFEPARWERMWKAGRLDQLRMSLKRFREISKSESDPGE